jgi:hypothetical protein
VDPIIDLDPTLDPAFDGSTFTDDFIQSLLPSSSAIDNLRGRPAFSNPQYLNTPALTPERDSGPNTTSPAVSNTRRKATSADKLALQEAKGLKSKKRSRR